MKNERAIRSLHMFILGSLIAVLAISMVPVQAAQAQDTTTSDLVVRLVSVPRHAKACEVFAVTFTVTNLGPDPVDFLNVSLVISDHFDIVSILPAPESLGIGETATITAEIKVTAFVPGETRTGRLLASATSESVTSIDPNPEDNFASGTIRLIARPVPSCGQ